ncbi:MAG: ankyrin repeat domain-containing protein [Treponema sp.]|nr:ankyrin repeat domain-containing protein [Treponema sp.]MBP3608235.1 ankyrin repeat domain-containing protein [Treponema sp.]
MNKIFLILFFSIALVSCNKIDSEKFMQENIDNPDGVVLAAVKTNDLKLVKEILKVSSMDSVKDSVNFFGRDNITALMWASRIGNEKIVKALLGCEADILLESAEGLNSFDYACLSGNLECIKLLYNSSINLNSFNDGDVSPLILASAKNMPNVVKFLIEKGAEVDLADSNGDTALMYAIYNDSIAVAKVLMKSGANPNISNKNGETPLSLASEKIKKILYK